MLWRHCQNRLFRCFWNGVGFYFLQSATSTVSDCGRLYSPVVFRIYNCNCLEFNTDAAFTVQHYGAQTTLFDVPAADPNARPPITIRR